MPIKKQVKQKNKTQKKILHKDTNILGSVTSKNSDKYLRKAVTRKSLRDTTTKLFFFFLPEILLFNGILNGHHLKTKTHVEIGKHTMSPHVLHLSITPNQNLIIEDGYDPIRLNLINGNFNFEINPSEVVVDTSNDLTLYDNDVLHQITEDLKEPDKTIEYPIIAQTMVYEDVLKPYSQKLYTSHIRSAITQRFFEPKIIPKDIFSYFDFPESESHNKQENIEVPNLDTITQEICYEETNTNSNNSTKIKFGLPFGWQRTIGAFVAMSFVFVLPLHAMNLVNNLRDTKIEIQNLSDNALHTLKKGTSAALVKNINQAETSFKDASDQFAKTQQTINQIGGLTNSILSTLPSTQKTYNTGQNLLKMGESLSIAGARLSQGFQAMEAELNPTPVSKIKILSTFTNAAIPHLKDTQKWLDKIDVEMIPQQQLEVFSLLQTKLPTLINTVEEFTELSKLAEQILGADGTKRYLLLFQNNTELRPTGGFIGSFAEIKINNGLIDSLNIPKGGSYDLQGSLKTNLIAPKPLQLLKARWEFQDANWFADFPTSSRQVIEFYTDSGGPSVDGVIAINATYISKLLGLLGPIEMPEYSRIINEKNFLFESQKIVELEYNKKENEPKKFIGDLAPKLLAKVIKKSSNDFLDLADLLGSGLATKEIQIYLQDENLQEDILKQGWGGAIKRTEGDYLMIVNTNLGGGKTDGVMTEDININVNMQTNGSIVNTVTIKRTHHGKPNALFSGVNNVNYLRLYIPKKSKLIHATGFSEPDSSLFESPNPKWTIDDDLYYSLANSTKHLQSNTDVMEESGKTVLGNWVQTSPGETSIVKFTYELPFKINEEGQETAIDAIKKIVGVKKHDRYTMIIQKQSGVINRQTNINLQYPKNKKILWSSDNLNNLVVSNESDAFVGVLFD